MTPADRVLVALTLSAMALIVVGLVIAAIVLLTTGGDDNVRAFRRKVLGG